MSGKAAKKSTDKGETNAGIQRKLDFGNVEYLQMGRHSRIIMKREEKLNALNEDLWEGLRKAFEEAMNDPEILVVSLRGSGRAFSAGDDIEMMSNWKNSDSQAWKEKYAEPLVSLLGTFPKPIIAAIDGIAAGGGCELIMLCDLIIATPNSTFSIPEGKIGAIPPIAITYGVSIMGRRLLRYAITGESFDAAEAKNLGLVDIVVEKRSLEKTLSEYESKIERMSPLSIETIKRVRTRVRKIMKNEFDYALNELVNLTLTEDFREGQEAFLNKRDPNWRRK